MAVYRQTSSDLMRKQNARTILNIIHHEQVVYRKMLALKANLAAQTITNIVTDLIRKGIVLEQPLNITGRGRNPYALRINYEGFHIVCVQITNFELDVYVSDLADHVYYEKRLTIFPNADALAMLKSALNEVIDTCSCHYKLFAIVISEAGIVDEKHGVIIEDYALRWHHLDLRSELESLHIPILLLNDVNIIAHYENSFEKDCANFMIVKVDNGVGSALVLDNRVVYSSNRVSGEFGHVTIFKSDESVECFCGRKNCLTRFISKGSLKRRLGKSYEEIKADVSKGIPETVQKIEEIGSMMASKLCDLIVLLDLERIILVGCVMEDFQDIVFPRLQQEIAHNMSFWVPFNKLEVKRYEFFPTLCTRYAIDYYLSAESSPTFLWGTII